jgi:hypothetical protein
VRLTRDGRELDRVGYGELTDPALYESRPAATATGGAVLARRPDGHDTGDNATDFVAGPPTPGARHFADRTCARFGIPAKRLTPDALRVLQAYRWPGNVRELENIIERTVALEPAEIISSGSLPEHLRGQPTDARLEAVSLPEEGIDLEEYLDMMRLSLMRRALERTGGHQKKAAELLRLSYRAFRYHAEKLGLVKDEETGA